MVITLTPDLEQAILEQARRQGTSPEQIALASLRKQFITTVRDERKVDAPGSLFDFLAGYIGVLHSSQEIEGGAQMSNKTGKRFAAGMVKKREQRRL